MRWNSIILLSLFLFTGWMLPAQNLSLNTELLSNVSFNENSSDIWGFTKDGVKYAIIGNISKASIFSLEDPQKPVLRYQALGDNSIWRDIKYYNDHLYITADQGVGGVVIIDMSKAPAIISQTNFKPLVTLGAEVNKELQRCHTLYIDEKGYMYLSGCNVSRRGVLIFDLKPDPKKPVYIGSADINYSHAALVRGDTMYSSEINVGKLNIYNIKDRSKPVLVASQTTSRAFTHNAWISDDSRYAFTTDEKSGGYVDAYDISDFNNIRLLDKFRPLDRENDGVIPHNTYYYKCYLITSWYTDGLRIVDAHRPDNMVEVAYYDTWEDQRVCHNGFSGCWGAFPFTDSDIIYGSDINNGLFIVKVDYIRACYLEGKISTSNGAGISNALVEIVSDQVNRKLSSPSGDYKTGQVLSGTFKVKITHPDYISKEATIQLKNGEVTTLNVFLEKRINTTVDLTIKDKTGNILPVNVLFSGDGAKTQIVTGNSPGFKAQVPSGKYDVFLSLWGYRNINISSFTVDASPSLKIEKVLERGYEDNFENNLGWTVNNSSGVNGAWERATPRRTDSGTGKISNPNNDSDDAGSFAFVTGNGLPGAACNDVDNGSTELLSPLMELTGYVNPTINYDVWYFAGRGVSPANDTLIVKLSNGQTEVVIDKIFLSTDGWLKVKNIEVKKFILPSSNMRLKVIASDQAGNLEHIVEAGFDNFFIGERIASGSEDLLSSAKITISPNPAPDMIYVHTEGNMAHNSSFSIFDVLGRKVMDGNLDFHSVSIDVSQWQSGIYFLYIKNQKPVKIVKQ